MAKLVLYTTVTREDWDSAKPCFCSQCPISRSLTRTFGGIWETAYMTTLENGVTWYTFTGPAAADLQQLFDAEHGAFPGDTQLELIADVVV